MSGWPVGGWAAGVVLKTGPSAGGVTVAVAAVAIVVFESYQVMKILIQRMRLNADKLACECPSQCASVAGRRGLERRFSSFDR